MSKSARMLLRIDPEELAQVEQASSEAGVSVSEWARNAFRMALERAAMPAQEGKPPTPPVPSQEPLRGHGGEGNGAQGEPGDGVGSCPHETPDAGLDWGKLDSLDRAARFAEAVEDGLKLPAEWANSKSTAKVEWLNTHWPLRNPQADKA